MSQTIPTEHPAVVLRSHFKLVRVLLAVALTAVVALSVALVVVANDHDQITRGSAVRPAESIRYPGFSPATGRPESAPLAQREHRGADEGASGIDYSKNAATGDFGGDTPESLNGPGARTD